MPTFSLPFAPSTTAAQAKSHSSRTKFSNLPSRKRKRPNTSPSNSANEASNEERDGSDTGLVPPSTNPLSLTPAEIAQYRLAGLRLDEDLPSVKRFPHQGLPVRYSLNTDKKAPLRKDLKGKGKAVEESEHTEKEDEVEASWKGSGRGPQLRVQHLSVLTTILHRCLLEGDIERAKRAWAMLIRGQFGGKGVDLRQSGYWGIGAELLMRSLDTPTRKPSYDSDSEDEDEERNRTRNGWTWGSKEGLEKVKDYYERLILQHPYKRHFHGSVNSLDFWPAMIGCEIYGIQAEQKEGVHKLEREEQADDGEEVSGSETEASEGGEEEENVLDGRFSADQKRKDRRRKRRAERRWLRREDIRQTALVAAEKIAARLDELMGTPPFSDSQNLLRLRGMVALYIGDLSVPSKPIDDDDESEKEYNLRSSQRHSQRDHNERRFAYRQRMHDYERGKKRQLLEKEKAGAFFSRMEKAGGSLEDLKYLSLVADADADLDEDEE